jgi:hypothetical protein
MLICLHQIYSEDGSTEDSGLSQATY